MGVCNEKYKTILITNFCKCKKIKLQQNYLGGETYGVYWMWKRIKRIFILYLCWKFFVFLLQIHVIESKGVVEKKKVKMNDNTHTRTHTFNMVKSRTSYVFWKVFGHLLDETMVMSHGPWNHDYVQLSHGRVVDDLYYWFQDDLFV